jgi:hypothetical protein
MHADLSGKYVQFAIELGKRDGQLSLVYRMGGWAIQVSGD